MCSSLRGVPLGLRPSGMGEPYPNRKCVPPEGTQQVVGQGQRGRALTLGALWASQLVTLSPLSSSEEISSHTLTRSFIMALVGSKPTINGPPGWLTSPLTSDS